MILPARAVAMAAVVGGLLWFPPDLLTNAWPAEDDEGVTNRPLMLVYIGMSALSTALLAVALWGLRALHRDRGQPWGRAGNVGAALGVAGFALVFANSVLAAALALRGEILDLFVLFGLGHLLLLAGMILVSVAARRRTVFGWARYAPLAAVAGIVLTLAEAVHKWGLLLFGLAWVALGVAVWSTRRAGSAAEAAAPA